MANTQTIPNQAKLDALEGVVASGDTVSCALYESTATIGVSTTAYTASGEASGAGYSAGGIAVSHSGPTTDSNKAIWTPSADIEFTTVTLTDVDCALLYNETRADAAMGVWTFPAVTLVAGDLLLSVPANEATNALLRIALAS
jgi:hypothetical protein